MATAGSEQATDDDSLARRLQDLPSKLFDTVYEFVFTASSAPVEIDLAYKPPAQLAVDRRSRQRFAAQYYGSEAGFHFLRNDRSLVRRWVESVAPSYQVLLQLVDVDGFLREYPRLKRLVDGDDFDELDGLLRSTPGLMIRRRVVTIDFYRKLEREDGCRRLTRALNPPDNAPAVEWAWLRDYYGECMDW